MNTTSTEAGPQRLTRKGQATRSKIVGAAADLMRRQGVAKTSTESVCEAAGVSNSQLYHYFADKDDLTHAVIEHQADQVLAVHRALLADLDSFAGLERWRDALAGDVAQTQGRCGCPVGGLVGELADADELARLALASCFSRWETMIRDGLLTMKERGELSPEADPGKLALATLAALQGGLLLTHAHRDPALFETALDAAVAHVRSFATRDADRARGPGHDTPAPAPAAAEPAVSASGDTPAPAAIGYCPHCRQPVTIVTRLTTP